MHGRNLFFRLSNPLERQYTYEIAAVRGFHYRFADYDSEVLETLSNVTLSHNEEGVMRMVLGARAKTGIADENFLDWFRAQQPQTYRLLKINPTEDNSYIRQLVILDRSPISAQEINPERQWL